MTRTYATTDLLFASALAYGTGACLPTAVAISAMYSAVGLRGFNPEFAL